MAVTGGIKELDMYFCFLEDMQRLREEWAAACRLNTKEFMET